MVPTQAAYRSLLVTALYLHLLRSILVELGPNFRTLLLSIISGHTKLDTHLILPIVPLYVHLIR
jgi:hypothetical protein